MKNLTSIAEHSDYLSASTYSYSEKWQLHRLRVKFGKQTLEKWMFLPCDENGNVLEMPDKKEDWFRKTYDNGWWNNFVNYKKEYNQAKERCLFERFEVQNTKDWIEFYGGIRFYIPSKDLGNMASVVFRESEPMNKTIEDLVKYNPELTPTALKTLGL